MVDQVRQHLRHDVACLLRVEPEFLRDPSDGATAQGLGDLAGRYRLILAVADPGADLAAQPALAELCDQSAQAAVLLQEVAQNLGDLRLAATLSRSVSARRKATGVA